LIRTKYSLLFVLLASQLANVQASNLGPAVELDCPCTFATDSVTSSVIEAGITNIGSTATDQLNIKVWAHTTASLSDSTNAALVADKPLTASLAANSSIARTSFKSGLGAPSDGTYYLTFQLINGDDLADSWRMEEQVTFKKAGGSSAGSFFYDSTPSIDIAGSSLTMNIPAIVNNNLSASQAVSVNIFATDNPDYYGSVGYTLASHDISSPIAAGSNSVAESPTFSYSPPPAGFDYYHMVVIDTNSQDTLAFQTVQVPSGTMLPSRSFSVSYLEILTMHHLHLVPARLMFWPYMGRA
jgi:hypothetical protein